MSASLSITPSRRPILFGTIRHYRVRSFLSRASCEALEVVLGQTEGRLSLRSASLCNVAPTWQQLGTMCYIAALPRDWLLMEDSMCWEIDYKFFAEQKRAQETRMKQERRAGLIDQLLDEANRQGEKTAEETPVKEAASAK